MASHFVLRIHKSHIILRECRSLEPCFVHEWEGYETKTEIHVLLGGSTNLEAIRYAIRLGLLGGICCCHPSINKFDVPGLESWIEMIGIPPLSLSKHWLNRNPVTCFVKMYYFGQLLHPTRTGWDWNQRGFHVLMFVSIVELGELEHNFGNTSRHVLVFYFSPDKINLFDNFSRILEIYLRSPETDIGRSHRYVIIDCTDFQTESGLFVRKLGWS